jgi:hypothetical protein
VKIPRDLSSDDLIKGLSQLGYEIGRQLKKMASIM